MSSDPKRAAGSTSRPAAEKADSAAQRQDRLAQALRDNLKKRKAQQRRRDARGTSGSLADPTGEDT